MCIINLGKEKTVEKTTPKINNELDKDDIIEQLEKSYRQEVDAPRLTADYIEETLQIA